MAYEDDDTGIGMKNGGTYISPSQSRSYQGDANINNGFSIQDGLNVVKNIGSSAIANSLSSVRLKAANLLGVFGGTANKTSIIPSWKSAQGITQGTGNGATTDDWRIKVAVSNKASFMESPMFAPIKDTNGVVFPILPQITVTHTARYSSQPLTHSNYSAHFYEGSEIAEIMINGEFIVQSVNDGKYLMAAIQFFRTTTKMYFGTKAGAETGTPPPLVYLSGFGDSYFSKVPCVVKSFTHTMTTDVDYVAIPSPNGSVTRLPTQSTIQVNLQPIYSRATVANFNLDQFASGDLITKGFL